MGKPVYNKKAHLIGTVIQLLSYVIFAAATIYEVQLTIENWQLQRLWSFLANKNVLPYLGIIGEFIVVEAIIFLICHIIHSVGKYYINKSHHL